MLGELLGMALWSFGVRSGSSLSCLSFLFNKMRPTCGPPRAEHLSTVGIHLETPGFALLAYGIHTHMALRK